MKIHNFRVGHATNSSSSHSVVLLPPELVGHVSPIDELRSADDQYGWDYFRVVSEEAKMRYLAAQLFSRLLNSRNESPSATLTMVVERLTREIPDFIADTDLVGTDRSWTDAKGTVHTYVDRTYPSVDHQSVLSFDKLTPKILDNLIDFFKSPRVVVLGGNDNDDSESNAVKGAEEIPAFRKLMSDGVTMRVKIEGPYWIIYDSSGGTKARVSLDPVAPDYTKAITPELVDLKITNYCGRGCNFCYQSSTTDGQHADFDEIIRVLDMLAAMEVFEVAIGGGEPTDHPRFAEIIEACVARNLTPNFTTLSDRWLEDEALLKMVAGHVGGIGVSCSDRKALALVGQIKEALASVDTRRWPGAKVSAQHVLGSVPISVTGELLDVAFRERLPVLLLGFKDVGFGATYERFDDAATPVAIKLAIDSARGDHIYPQLSVDTALVDQYPDLLTALGVPDALITSPEGKFSCYVDAVEKKVGPSSYVAPQEMTAVPQSVEEFKSVFARY